MTHIFKCKEGSAEPARGNVQRHLSGLTGSSHDLALLEFVNSGTIALCANLYRGSAGPLRSAGATEKLAGRGRCEGCCEGSHDYAARFFLLNDKQLSLKVQEWHPIPQKGHCVADMTFPD